MKRHIATHHLKIAQEKKLGSKISKPEKQYQCDICNDWFRTIQDVANHKQRIHFETEKIHCQICGKNVGVKLRRHMDEVHNDKEAAKCDMCDKKFYNKGNFKKHVKTVHRTVNNKAAESYTCDICNKEYFIIESLRHHYKSHENKVKDNHCVECNKQFSFHAWKNHMKIVHSNIQFKCQLCGKCFKNQIYLKNHSSTHIENDVECTMCGKFYNTNQSLAKHVGNYHSKKEKVKCNFCGKILSSEENLTLHQKNCKQIKMEKFHCDSCGKILKSETSLKKHFLLFHFQTSN